MKALILIIGLTHLLSQASGSVGNEPQLGMYSGFSETHESVGFELKKDGKAEVITFAYDGEDEKDKAVEESEPGTWSYKDPVLTLKYGKHADTFKVGSECPGGPCFRFVNSSSKQKSPMNVAYPFINWDAKPAAKPAKKPLSKPTSTTKPKKSK